MIFRSPFDSVEIPDIALTPFVLQRAAQHADKPALVEGLTGRTITYGELSRQAGTAATNLARRGLRKGDVAGIYSPNTPEYASAFHALALAGAVTTTINPAYTLDEVAHQLKDAGAKYLFAAESLWDKAYEAARCSGGVRELFVFGEAKDTTSFADLLSGDAPPPCVEINPHEDLAALPYSSGTTGLAKGVMLTHRNMVASIIQGETVGHTTANDVLICFLPLFHIYGLNVVLNLGLRTGATIVTLPRFQLEEFLQVMQDYGVTFAHLVPPVVLALAKNPIVDNYDLSKLKTIFCGAAPLGEELTRTCEMRLGCVIRQGYGMTETSPIITISPDDAAQITQGSVGWCAPATECKIVDVETNAELSFKERGELCVRGPQVMKGYLNQPDATAHTIDEDGWLHTGDIAYVDEDNSFYIVDRLKELIKYKGFQVAPAELEALLLAHPCVADAAVIPSPDEEAGEVPKAFIVLKEEVSAEALMEFVAARAAPHKKIRKLEFVEQIPKSASGKILRRVLVARERATPAT
ncbi:MAG: 4-coumarate--CoA ligase family protein [Pyrinomonadaceae bacterium]